nr:MAG TPA: hypothetical protein [Caudoviricetes sp.]
MPPRLSPETLKFFNRLRKHTFSDCYGLIPLPTIVGLKSTYSAHNPMGLMSSPVSSSACSLCPL